jgi:hypothetical protein
MALRCFPRLTSWAIGWRRCATKANAWILHSLRSFRMTLRGGEGLKEVMAWEEKQEMQIPRLAQKQALARDDILKGRIPQTSVQFKTTRTES